MRKLPTNIHPPTHTHTTQARVKAAGGRVVFKAGSHRVMGLLAMSRALGDHFLRPYVIADPEVASFQRSGDDEMLLLATVSCPAALTARLTALLTALLTAPTGVR